MSHGGWLHSIKGEPVNAQFGVNIGLACTLNVDLPYHIG